MRYIKILSLSTLILSAAFTSCTSADSKVENELTSVPEPTTTPAITTTQQMPAFTLVDATGKTVDLKSFAGKKVFVNLWASWCPPCRAEMPSIEKLHQSVDKEKAVFVLLSLDNDFETAKKYIQSKGLNLPIYYPSDNLPDLFNVRGIPATFIFNEKGELIKQHEGADDYNTDAYRQMLQS
jgi:thiol-disulfide isomerase/thioredoxin